MSDYINILSSIYDNTWAILPERLLTIEHYVKCRASGADLPEISAEIKAEHASRTRTVDAGSVAVIPVFGTMAQRMSAMAAASGGVSTEALKASIQTALDDNSVHSIVLNIDSPGGTVAGTPELADFVRNVRKVKPIVAHANSMAASAAYWLASQATEITVTPSGSVGSIGAMVIHADRSAQLEAEGVKPTIIASSKFKAEGNPFEPLADDSLSHIQAEIDKWGAKFEATVAKGRGVPVANVREDFGQGRMLSADDALAVGMVDRVEQLGQTITRLQRDAKQRSRTNMAARKLQMLD